MKGLILKDLYTIKKQFLFVIFFCIMYAVYGVILKNPGMYTTFITIFLGMLSITTMSYDERSGWNGYSVILPVTRSDIVKAKYYLGYLFIIPTGIIALPVNIIVERKINSQILIDSLISVIFSIALAGIMIAVLFPFIFKFGVEKGRIILILVGALVGGIFGALFVLWSVNDIMTFVHIHAMAIIALILTLVSNFVSIFISIRIYEKKEF